MASPIPPICLLYAAVVSIDSRSRRSKKLWNESRYSRAWKDMSSATWKGRQVLLLVENRKYGSHGKKNANMAQKAKLRFNAKLASSHYSCRPINNAI